MPPQEVTFPHRRFVLTQTVLGVETNVMVSTPLASNFTTDRVERATALEGAFAAKNAQPGVLYKLYSPSNGTNVPHTDGDCVWRSDIEYAP
jgi:hypothetical protein